jgi:AcrR family transcriptional regulator
MKRLSKDARREQLLQAAMAIVARSGADALTLGSLAEHAAISKPVVYEHFRTRSGLLIALYRQIDTRQVKALVKAVERAPKRLHDVARIVAGAYMRCYAEVGPEWHAISAALKGDEEMNAAQQEMIDGYVELYCTVLAPFSKLAASDLRLRCIGIVGAAEAISQAMILRRTSEAKAIDTLAAMITRAIRP